MTQYYKIANLTVAMASFGRTARQAEPYRLETARRADIVITSNWKALQESQPHLSQDDCEYLSTGSSFYKQLLMFDGMLLHASAVVMDGYAYLFSAPCGTGKSTHTRLWTENLKGAFLLNDDKPALRWENGTLYAYGTPWSGKTGLNRNLRIPVVGICVLRRGAENQIDPCPLPEAIHALLEQTVRPRDPEGMQRLLTLLDRLIPTVRVWKMECNMDPAAALMSYNAMSAGRKEE